MTDNFSNRCSTAPQSAVSTTTFRTLLFLNGNTSNLYALSAYAMVGLLLSDQRVQVLKVPPGSGPRVGDVVSGQEWEELTVARRAQAQANIEPATPPADVVGFLGTMDFVPEERDYAAHSNPTAPVLKEVAQDERSKMYDFFKNGNSGLSDRWQNDVD